MQCLGKITPIGDSVCRKCGKPINSNSPSRICLGCIESPPSFTIHRSFSFYEGVLREIILLMKFQKIKILGKILAKIAHENFRNDSDLFDCDFIVPVPISRKRMRERGFNQSEEIAKELAKLLKKRILKNILIKKFHTIPQSLLSLRERRKNILGSFEVRKKELVRGKRILLVDDIYTSGSTVSECCKTLYKSGVKEVKVFTIARGGTGDFPITLEMLDS